MNKKLFSYFSAGILALSCYLPPLYLFTDTFVLPKFYLLLLSVGCMGLWVALAKGRGWKLPPLNDSLRKGGMLYVAASVLECLYVLGLMVSEGFPQWGVCGTFENPAGLALNLCVAIPIAIEMLIGRWRLGKGKRKAELALWLLATVLMATVLVFTRSRTGLICLSFFLVVYACRGIHRLVCKRSVRKWLYGVAVVAVSASLVLLVCFHKEDSTSGRAFILGRTWELVKEHPLVGHGAGGFEREYMLRQAAYFKEHPDSEFALLADDIRHPLNEFLLLWVDYGVLGPVLLLAVLAAPLWMVFSMRGKRRLGGKNGKAEVGESEKKHESMEVLSLPMVAVFVFSCLSYPFHYPAAWLVVGCALLTLAAKLVRMLLNERSRKTIAYMALFAGVAVLALTINDAVHEYRWNRAYRHSFRERAALEEYERLHGYFASNPYFLYSYAMASFKRGDLDRASRMIEECGKYRSGYNRELLAADICFYRKDYAEAAAHYELASRMCPVRFAPLEGLYKVHEATGDTLRRDEVARRIARKQVKVQSRDVKRIKKRCQ